MSSADRSVAARLTPSGGQSSSASRSPSMPPRSSVPSMPPLDKLQISDCDSDFSNSTQRRRASSLESRPPPEDAKVHKRKGRKNLSMQDEDEPHHLRTLQPSAPSFPPISLAQFAQLDKASTKTGEEQGSSKTIEGKEGDEGDRDIELKLNQQIDDEYELLLQQQAQNKEPLYSTEGPKNRYKNILPYKDEKYRILLGNRKDCPSNYINASAIKTTGQMKVPFYIAASAPLLETAEDWWRMIWEQDVMILVMLTKLKEQDQVKADRYWPNKKESHKEFGCMHIEHVKDITRPEYYIREFKLAHSEQSEPPRQILHFQYVAWADHGIPEIPPFLEFLGNYRNARDYFLKDGNHCPVLVHCSAGIGRTGCFLVMDCIMDILQKPVKGLPLEQQTLSVFDLVAGLRKQRAGMVQTREQYWFVYRTLAKHIKQILSAKQLIVPT